MPKQYPSIKFLKWKTPRSHMHQKVYIHNRPKTQSTIIAYSTANQGTAQVIFDTDIFPIRVDNCCTRTLSFEINDFLPDTLVTVTNKAVAGFCSKYNNANYQYWDH